MRTITGTTFHFARPRRGCDTTRLVWIIAEMSRMFVALVDIVRDGRSKLSRCAFSSGSPPPVSPAVPRPTSSVFVLVVLVRKNELVCTSFK